MHKSCCAVPLGDFILHINRLFHTNEQLCCFDCSVLCFHMTPPKPRNFFHLWTAARATEQQATYCKCLKAFSWPKLKKRSCIWPWSLRFNNMKGMLKNFPCYPPPPIPHPTISLDFGDWKYNKVSRRGFVKKKSVASFTALLKAIAVNDENKLENPWLFNRHSKTTARVTSNQNKYTITIELEFFPAKSVKKIY